MESRRTYKPNIGVGSLAEMISWCLSGAAMLGFYGCIIKRTLVLGMFLQISTLVFCNDDVVNAVRQDGFAIVIWVIVDLHAWFWNLDFSCFFGCFLGMLLETLFFIKNYWIFDKNECEKHNIMDFQWMFNTLFHQLFLESADLFNARNQKNSDFPPEKCILL